ncbi:MAG: PxKF domain-containing protein, partial [Actinomycetota bacterium]|nr:PxKF domain-containing protein [Actinomycetota bacterium]
GGRQYLVAVDSPESSGQGQLVLRWDPPPPNNDFAHAAPIVGGDGEATGTLVGASLEPGEPRHGYSTGGAGTVWFRWTAPGDGVFRFTTAGSERNVVLSAYLGEAVGALVEVAGDDASQLAFPFPANVSVMTLVARAGTTYAVAAADHCPDNCRVYLYIFFIWALVPAPANDRFIDAAQVAGASGRVLADNLGALKEDSEPAHAGEPGGGSVWYRWTAPQSGRFSFDVLRSHGAHAVLEVYAGSSLSALTPVPRAGTASLLASSSPSDPLSARRGFASFEAVEGTTYVVAVDTRDTTRFESRRSDILVAWDPAPDNDDLASATPLPAAGVPVTGTTDGASVTEEERRGAHASVWYRWVAPHDGVFRFEAQSDVWVPSVQTYRGTTEASLEIVELREFAPEGTFVLEARAGEEFAVAVAGRHLYGFGLAFGGAEAGPFALAWTELPPNDDFADALDLTGAEGSLSGFTSGATYETDERGPYGKVDGASVWYRWTAPADGVVQFAVEADFDAIIAVYEGEQLAGLKGVEHLGDFGELPRSITFAAVAARTYAVVVDGFSNDSGPFTLTWRPRLLPRYSFEGFFPPVANEPALNRVTAGRTVPVKFRLWDDVGPVSDLAAVKYLSSAPVTCPGPSGSVPSSGEEAESAAGLRYDATDQQYVFGWETVSSFAGSCRRLEVGLDDGQVFSALFDFR